MKIHGLILLLILCFSGISQGQQIDSKTQLLDSIFEKFPEVYFSCEINEVKELQSLSKIISIHNFKKGRVTAFASRREFSKFLELNKPYSILLHPGLADTNPSMNNHLSAKDIQDWDAYPTYNSYVSMMNQFAADYPSLCRTYTIKTLSSGRKIMLLKISANVDADENEPEFLYSAAIHGNETSGYVLLLRLADTLLSSYGNNPKLTALLDDIELWICPLANPDGTFEYSNGSSIFGATRENNNGVDLNRNFPDPVGGQHPDDEAWQPETEAFMGFADTMDFVMAANFHEGTEVINYPWDCKYALTADDDWWTYVSHEYADTAQAFGPTDYLTDLNPDGITNGADWYVIWGGRQDYMNYFRHCREETAEISIDFSPSGSYLPTLWEANRRSLINYMDRARLGARGVVSDSCSGLPLSAKVFINGHDLDSSHVYSSMPIGNYHRLLYSGSYNLTFSCSGYQSLTIPVTITNSAATVNDVMLKPIQPDAAFSYVQDEWNVDFANESVNADSYYWDFGDGLSSTDANPSHTYTAPGNYTITLTAYNSCVADTMEVGIVVAGIDELNTSTQFSIYPNPVTDQLILSGKDLPAGISIQIYDTKGELVINQIVDRSTESIDITSLAKGLYLIKLITNASSSNIRFVKQ